ncbi:MAG TPA: alpha/beta fold hydrolase [Thermoanaerobaculia bacterium]|jgi:pimeloyl-ACP methyl ester carboxylesterase
MLVFHDNGDGRPIVWIHGFPHASAIFQPQLSIAGVRHIRVDLPGFGASKPPSGQVGMADYSREIIAVLDHLRVDKIIAAGISMGGYILMQMLRDAPQRIEGVILIDTRERADSDRGREDRLKTIAEIEKNGIEPIVDSMLPKMILTPSRRDAFREIMMTSTPAGMIAAQRAMSARPDSSSTLRALKAPALVIVGDHDPITSVDDARRMSALINGSKHVVIDNAAHASNFDQPDAFNRAVTEFLSK